MTTFPQPGRYKLWGQFNRNGKVVVADFWVNVLWNGKGQKMLSGYLFFLPLAIGAFWLHHRVREELICIVIIIGGMSSLMLGLILSPWFIKLLMLIVLTWPDSLLTSLFLRRK